MHQRHKDVQAILRPGCAGDNESPELLFAVGPHIIGTPRPAGAQRAVTVSLLWLLRASLTALLALSLLLRAVPVRAQQPFPLAWEEWVHLEGVVDVAGPRADGHLVAMAAGRLYLVSPAGGAITPYPTDYAGPADAESYVVLIPDLPPSPAGCVFARDDLFILDLTSPGGQGLIRVDSSGRASRFADLPEADWLFGIAVDTVGAFGHRLLVTGTRADRTFVFAVDCLGQRTVITSSSPFVEGGYAVAPSTFGAFAGHLIAPDEFTDQIWAISPDGTVRLVLAPGLPSGGDIGVESLGFIPPGFFSSTSAAGSGAAYLADRGTPGNPFPGTDSLMRLPAAALASAGVREGDLLVSTEGGGLTITVRCDQTGCTSLPVATGPQGGTIGHIEGRIAFAP